MICEMKRDYFAILDNSREDINTKCSFVFTNPKKTITAKNYSDIDDCLSEIQGGIDEGYYAVGFYAYEVGYHLIEKLNDRRKKNSESPLIEVVLFSNRYSVNDVEVDSILKELSGNEYGGIKHPKLNMEKEEYLDSLNKIHQHIVDGNTYQINYTLKFKFDFLGNPSAFYSALRQRQKVGYGAYLHFPSLDVLSRSPELYFRKDGDNLMTKPMKGTITRGKTKDEDLDNINTLSSDAKSKAENIMIVDLLRNDMSRVCKSGSVKVKDIFEVQTFSTLHQMISTVEAKVENNISITHLLKNLFPCGSITGAPKISSMEIINDLEKEERGVYTGAIGYISPDNDMCFNVPIRSICLDKSGKGEMGIGSGVVYDSDPVAEYEECLLKSKFLIDCVKKYNLFESILFDKQICDIDSHLIRLSLSAKHLGFEYDKQKCIELINNASTNLHGKHKIRLTLSRDGTANVEAIPIAPEDSNQPKKITISPVNVNSKNYLLHHKTAERNLYDNTYAIYKNLGFYDVVFANEKKQITECTFNNIFIVKNGIWKTPKLSCGLLAGTQRQRLINLSNNNVQEDILYLSDLKEADNVYLTNAIRGIVEVTFEYENGEAPCFA